MLLCMTLFCTSLIISNCVIIGTCGFSKDAIVFGLILMFLCTISIASITTLISMITKNEIGALAPLLVTFLMLLFFYINLKSETK